MRVVKHLSLSLPNRSAAAETQEWNLTLRARGLRPDMNGWHFTFLERGGGKTNGCDPQTAAATTRHQRPRGQTRHWMEGGVAYQSPLWLDERSVLAVHLVIEPTGVAEIMSVAVSPPQWGRSSAAVDTFSAL